MESWIVRTLRSLKDKDGHLGYDAMETHKYIVYTGSIVSHKVWSRSIRKYRCTRCGWNFFIQLSAYQDTKLVSSIYLDSNFDNCDTQVMDKALG